MLNHMGENKMNLDEIFSAAPELSGRVGVDQAYSISKNDIIKLNLTPVEYQNAIQRLCEILDY